MRQRLTCPWLSSRSGQLKPSRRFANKVRKMETYLYG